MSAVSAGLLVWRRSSNGPEFLLAHPGGPFWAKRDEAAWSIPKGLVEPGEASWDAARREFLEETGQAIDAGTTAVALRPCRTPGGKTIHAWLVAADLDVAAFRSVDVEIEWPPRSGRVVSFPEMDRAAYFDAATAATRIHKGQRPLLAEAVARLSDAR